MISVSIALLFGSLLASTSALEVSTSLGDIQGAILKTRLGKDIYAFRGIRYAKSPEGPLRFKIPQPVDPWKPKVFDATVDGPMCPQILFNSSDYSEDCLRLNVYSKDLDKKALKPVVVYIHPGGFYSFSGESKYFAGPQPLMDRDIVLVTINYRIGTLGFIATGTEHAPGNLGLKDQVVALKWVKDHIRNFGGDPNSVTTMGYSAGSFSIGLHMTSPMSKGLFHRAIIMSASPVSQVKYPTDQLNLAKKQAGLVNCPTNTIDAMMKCLSEISADEFVRTHEAMFPFAYNPVLNWQPVLEKDFGQERFIIEDPIKSFQAGRFQRIPLIVGMNEYEFVTMAHYVLQNETLTKQLKDNWETLAPISFLYDQDIPKSRKDEITRVLTKEYLDNKPLVVNGPYKKLGEIFSDSLIGFAVHRLAHLAARFVDVHYYRFSYKGRYSFFKFPDNTTLGAAHHDELLYLINIPAIAPLFSKTDPEDTTVERLTRMWTQFAKTSDPNNPNDEYLKNLRWDPLDLKKENYLDIGNELTMKRGLYLERFEIWRRLFPLDWSGVPCKHNQENVDYPEPEETGHHHHHHHH